MYRRVWIVTATKFGFTVKILVETTENGLREYIASEMPHAVKYTGATDEQIKAAKTLGMPIYMYKDVF